jgi:nucleotide-binding universal stress UspA family protein
MPRQTMFRSILVPLDGSAFAEQAVPLAAGLANRAGGKLRLVLVHRTPTMPLDSASPKLYTSVELATRKAEHAYLHGFAERLRQAGTTVTSAVTLSGPIGSSLVEYVTEVGIDLVVMATHGLGGLQRAWLGSVADYLVRTLEVPVFLVRPFEKGTAAPRDLGKGQILVPMDGSPLAEEMLECAAELARSWDSEILLLQVVQPLNLVQDAMLPLPSGYDEELTNLWRNQAQAYVEGLATRLREHGLRAIGAAVIGRNTVETILAAAHPERTSAIALATHGRSGVRRLALGSVADKLVRSADVPVLVYHPSSLRQEKPKPSSRESVTPPKMAAKAER